MAVTGRSRLVPSFGGVGQIARPGERRGVAKVGRGTRVSAPALLSPLSWHRRVSRTIRGIVRLPAADQARRNAAVAADHLTLRRDEREAVDRFLSAHAALARDESATAV